jgi:hypothetical protein
LRHANRAENHLEVGESKQSRRKTTPDDLQEKLIEKRT